MLSAKSNPESKWGKARAPLRWLALFAALIATPALACPAVDKGAMDAARDPLFERLLETKSEAEAEPVVDTIWLSWATAPDQRAQRLLDEGMSRIRQADCGKADELLSDLIAYCPDYAEGWNQRAFARFLSNDLEGALEDLDRALQLEPRHFGALAGKALTLLRQGRTTLGQQALEAAVKLNPWLKERHLLVPSEKT